MVKRLTITILTGLAACGHVGCDPAPIYQPPHPDLSIGSVPDRSGWRLTGTLANAAAAADGNIATIARAESRGGGALTIDLGKPGVFNMVVLDHGKEEFGYAGRARVLTSVDGRSFVPRHNAPGTRRVSSYLLISPVLARYVRIQVTRPGPKPWAVAEIHLQ